MNTCEYCGTQYVPYSTTVPQKYCAKRCSALANNYKATERKKDMLALIKLERGCIDCGYNSNACALHFDHLPGTDKLFNLAQAAASQGLSRILAEVDKCEVVCANCHAVRTGGRGGWKPRGEGQAIQQALL